MISRITSKLLPSKTKFNERRSGMGEMGVNDSTELTLNLCSDIVQHT